MTLLSTTYLHRC